MKKETQLLLIMVLGLIVGNIIGSGCISAGHLTWLGYNMVFGMTSPVVLNLGAMSGSSYSQIVRDKIFRNCPIIRQCMYCAGNKMWKFFIWKDLCINKTAKTKCSYKNVNFPKFASCCIQ